MPPRKARRPIPRSPRRKSLVGNLKSMLGKPKTRPRRNRSGGGRRASAPLAALKRDGRTMSMLTIIIAVGAARRPVHAVPGISRAVGRQGRQAPHRDDQGAACRQHAGGQCAGADPQADGRAPGQRRRLRARRSIPKPALLRKRLEQTGKTLDARQICHDVSFGIVVVVAAVLMMRGAPFLLALFVGLFVGIGFPHFIVGKMIKRRVNKFNCQLPRRDRADGPRPAFGPADHRNARHRRQRNSAARSGSSSAPCPTR